MTDATVLRGECLCGRVAYAVDDAFAYAMNCHCGGCRRTTGSAFKPMGGIAIDRIAVTRGRDHLLRHGKPAAEDIHCATCGSLLYSVVRGGAYAHVAYGTLVDAPSRPPDHHIFVADKAPWFPITDALPQWAGHVGQSARLDAGAPVSAGPPAAAP
jgi:hypothetical protein